MVPIKSGPPCAGPNCLEKPRTGRCGKWLFGSMSVLLNVLDPLVSPRSLPVRTKKLYGVRRQTGYDISNTPKPCEVLGRRRRGRGAPGRADLTHSRAGSGFYITLLSIC